MGRPTFLLIAVLASAGAFGQLRAPERSLAQVQDPAMVVLDRGAQLEVLPKQRAQSSVDASNRAVIHVMTTASANDPIGRTSMGVVFNHAMQQQGYISGEIAFQLKPGSSVAGMGAALYPGLKKITNPRVYVVNARTPAEFIAVLKRLQARSDLEWVEPTITYGPATTTPSAR